MEKGRVFTGARARLLIGAVKVGYATNVSGSEEIEYQPIEVLDNIEVEEFVPVAYRVTCTASMVRVIGETIKSQGYFPQSGNSPEDHLLNILNTGDLVATVEDSKTGRNMMVLEQMKVQSRNFTINAKGVVGKDVTFVAVRMRDESEVA
jgi:hypothetical protein